jgi:hypothetical protein
MILKLSASAWIVVVFVLGFAHLESDKVRTLASEEPLPAPLVSEEPLIELRTPGRLVQQLLGDLLKGAPSIIKKINPIALSPNNGLVSLSGTIQLPEELMQLVDPQTTEHSRATEIDFRFAFVPRIEMREREHALSLEFKSLQINDQDFIHVFPILSRVATAFLSDSRLLRFVQDKEIAANETLYAEANISLRVSEYLKKKHIQFHERSRSISLKLAIDQIVNLESVKALEEYTEYLADLRLWYFAPMRLKGTRETVFYVVVGAGAPSEAWQAQLRSRLETDAIFLLDSRKTEIAELTDHARHLAHLEEALERYRAQFGLFELSVRESRSLTQLRERWRETVESRLSLSDAMFVADPTGEVERVLNKLEGESVATLEQIKAKREIENKLRSDSQSLARNEDLPFLETRVSQKTLHSVVRFFRDFEFREDALFKDLRVEIAPEIPGLVVQGLVKLNLGSFGSLNEGLLDAGAKVDAALGERVPFEAKIELLHEPSGWLRVTFQEVTLLSGPQKLTLRPSERNGKLILDLAQKIVMRTLLGSVIEKDVGEPAETSIVRERELKSRFEAFLKALPRQYREVIEGFGPRPERFEARSSQELLVRLMEVDFFKNPQIEVGKQEIEKKLSILLSDYIKYDGVSLRLSINPSLFLTGLTPPERPMYVWNIEPVWVKALERGYLDFAVGYGPRSQRYHEYLYRRPERRESVDPRVERSFTQNAVDFSVSVGLQDLSKTLNYILSSIKRDMERDIRAKLAQEKEQTHYKFNDIRVSAFRPGQIELSLTASTIKKAKHSIFNPARFIDGEKWYEIEEAIAIKAYANLTVEKLDRYLTKVQVRDRNVFFGSQVLKVDLVRASIETEKYKLFQKILSLVGFNVKDVQFERSSLENKVKMLILKTIAPYFDDALNEGNTRIGSFALNKFSRVYVTEQDILVQLNPRFASAAFDVAVLPNQMHGGSSYGLRIDPAQDRMSVDFSTAGGMAATDKREILEIVKQARMIMKPYREERDLLRLRQRLDSGEIKEKISLSANAESPSLMGRLGRLVQYYPEIAQVRVDEGAEGRELKEGQRLLSECGIELAYFVSALYGIHAELSALKDLIESRGWSAEFSQSPGYRYLTQTIEQLEKRRIIPYAEIYERKFLRKNQQILRRGLTDWNQAFYADAAFGANVMDLVMGLALPRRQ